MIISSRSVYSVHRPLSIDRLLRDELKTLLFPSIQLSLNNISPLLSRIWQTQCAINFSSNVPVSLFSLSIFSPLFFSRDKIQTRKKKEGRTGIKSRLHTHQRTLYSNAKREEGSRRSLSLSHCSKWKVTKGTRERKRIDRSNYARFKENGRDGTSKLKYQVRVR